MPNVSKPKPFPHRLGKKIVVPLADVFAEPPSVSKDKGRYTVTTVGDGSTNWVLTRIQEVGKCRT